MKINLTPEFLKELQDIGFQVKLTVINGEHCYLIHAGHNMGLPFTADTRIFRSSMWNSFGELISAGFIKFWNIGEKPGLSPDPTDSQLNKAFFVNKEDGTCTIWSKYNGELIIRTRGSVDARLLPNGDEINQLMQKYPLAAENPLVNSGNYSLIFEWVSPSVSEYYGIVAKHDELDMYLVGGIFHNKYDHLTQWELDDIAELYHFKRPQYYNMQKKSLTELSEIVKSWVNQEGICVYYPVGYYPYWEIKKLKTLDYLTKHAFQNNVTLVSTLELYLKSGEIGYTPFLNKLKIDLNLDWEIVQLAAPYVSKITNAKEEIDRILDHMRQFIKYNGLLNKPRKDAAKMVIASYGNTMRASILFNFLDGKEISDKQKLQLYYQILDIQ